MNQNEIKSIKKLKKKGYYEVQINLDKYEISEDLIVKYSLINGKIISDIELNELSKSIEDEKYYQKVYHYISFMPRSEQEIRKYLNDLKCTITLENKIIKRLKDVGLIDDELLAKSILNTCINSCKGPKILKQKLYERKIPNSISKDLLYDPVVEEETIYKVISKNINKNIKYPISKQRNLLIAKLLRDGFTEDLIFHIIKNVGFIDDSEDELLKTIEKLTYKYRNFDDKDKKNKIITNLLSKGYNYETITKALNKIDD